MRKHLSLLVILAVLPLPVMASANEWFLPGITLMTVISVIFATVITQRFESLESTGIKVLTFGLFFWVLMFAQAIIYALFLH